MIRDIGNAITLWIILFFAVEILFFIGTSIINLIRKNESKEREKLKMQNCFFTVLSIIPVLVKLVFLFPFTSGQFIESILCFILMPFIYFIITILMWILNYVFHFLCLIPDEIDISEENRGVMYTEYLLASILSSIAVVPGVIV